MRLLFCIVAGLVALLAGALAIAACVRSGQISRELDGIEGDDDA